MPQKILGVADCCRVTWKKYALSGRNSFGRFEVLGAAGGDIKNWNRDLVSIALSFFVGPAQSPEEFVIGNDRETYDVSSFKKLGEAQVSVTAGTDIESLSIVVTKLFPSPPPFHTLKPHDHQPSGKWATIKATPNSSDPLIAAACSACNQPQDVMNTAKVFMQKSPLGLEHLDWYLSKNGADFIEDLNILRWLDQDSHIRARLKREIFPAGKKPKSEGHFTFPRGDFDTTKTENFALSFGEIDRVDFSVDFSDDTVRVWFQDRYEFHPVYPGIYTKSSGDFVRGDNCVHAAAVEMKSQGAQDYWMKGQAVVPLSLITAP